MHLWGAEVMHLYIKHNLLYATLFIIKYSLFYQNLFFFLSSPKKKVVKTADGISTVVILTVEFCTVFLFTVGILTTGNCTVVLGGICTAGILTVGNCTVVLGGICTVGNYTIGNCTVGFLSSKCFNSKDL